MHARGVVHRDIKPANLVLVDRRVDQAKLIDFGIARSRTASVALTQAGSTFGPSCPNRSTRSRARPADGAVRAIRTDALTAGLLGAGFLVDKTAGELLLREAREVDDAARTLLGKRAPFVGRDRELRSLEDLFDECVEQPVARPVVVTAGAGVGKSRLRSELAASIRRRAETRRSGSRTDIRCDPARRSRRSPRS